MEYAYYAKLIKDGFHTQCTLDLEFGAVKIQEVPFEFRNTEAYEAAHFMQEPLRTKKNDMMHTGRYKNSWNQILYNAKQSISGGIEESIDARR